MAGHVEKIEISTYTILTSRSTGKEALGRARRSLIEWILKKQVSVLGIGLVRLRIGVIGEPL